MVVGSAEIGTTVDIRIFRSDVGCIVVAGSKVIKLTIMGGVDRATVGCDMVISLVIVPTIVGTNIIF